VEWLSGQITKHSPLGPCNTSSMHNANQKACQNDIKKNGHVIYLKYSFEVNFISFQQITWKVECMSLHIGGKTFAPTSNGLERGMDQNYWHLLL